MCIKFGFNQTPNEYNLNFSGQQQNSGSIANLESTRIYNEI